MRKKSAAVFLSAVLLLLLSGLALLIRAVFFQKEESVLFFADEEVTDGYFQSSGRAVKVGSTVYAITDNNYFPEEGLFRLRSENTEDHHTKTLLSAEELNAEDARDLKYYRGSLYFTVDNLSKELPARLVRFNTKNGKTEILSASESRAKSGWIQYGRWMKFENERFVFYDLETERPVGSLSLTPHAAYLGAMQGKLYFSVGRRILACNAYGELTDAGKHNSDDFKIVPANGRFYVLNDPTPYDDEPSASVFVYDAQTFTKEKQIPVPFECMGWMAVTETDIFLEEEKPGTDHEGPLWKMDLSGETFICLNENRYYCVGASILDGQPAEYVCSLNMDQYYDVPPASGETAPAGL